MTDDASREEQRRHEDSRPRAGHPAARPRAWLRCLGIAFAGSMACAPAVQGAQWARIYDFRNELSNYQIVANAILPSADGSYLLAGCAQHLRPYYRERAWVAKLDPGGDVLWAKLYGSPSTGVCATDARVTADGGIVLAGTLGGAAWVTKLGPQGEIVWQKVYGASDSSGRAISPTPDGGYIVAGSTYPRGAGNEDAWVLRLDSGGGIVWQRTYGTIQEDHARAIAQTRDGGFVIAGWTTGQPGSWVAWLDRDGNAVRQARYAGGASALVPTADGGIALVGSIASPSGSGRVDAWALRLDAGGSVLWQKGYGGPAGDFHANAVAPTPDGGLVIGGDAAPTGALPDAWLLKLDGAGNVQWHRSFGDYGLDTLLAVLPAPEGGYVAAGYYGFMGAFSGHPALLLKVDATGAIAGCGIMRTPPAIGGLGFTGEASFVASLAPSAATSADGTASAVDAVPWTIAMCYSPDVPTVAATEVPALSGNTRIALAALLAIAAAAALRRRRRR